MPTRLPRFLLLSLLAHAVVIAALRVPAIPASVGQTLDVTLLPPSIATRSGAAPRNPGIAVHAVRTAIPVKAASHVKEPAPRSMTEASDSRAASVRANSSPEIQTAARRADLAGTRPPASATGHRLVHQILRASAPYFHYPLLAREQGWEGRVTIRLRVGLHGRLSRMRLAGSSGYAVLDAAALHSLRRVTHLPDGTMPANGGGFDVLVPIVYRLTES